MNGMNHDYLFDECQTRLAKRGYMYAAEMAETKKRSNLNIFHDCEDLAIFLRHSDVGNVLTKIVRVRQFVADMCAARFIGITWFQL